MSACRCGERKRPLRSDLPAGSNQRPRQWFVLKRNYSISAFNGGRREWSASSWICCRVCGAHWSTQSQTTVDNLDDSEFFPGGHEPKVEPWSDL